jgi:mono/diheme cytochrome c family protein
MRVTAILLLLPLSLLLLAASPAPPPDPASLVATGKIAFAAKCGACHPLDRPLGKTKDIAGWDTTVARMIGKAPASFAAGDKESIVAYLAGKSLLETSCATCHTLENTANGRGRAAWTTTIARMQKYAKGKISDGDAALIAIYLSVERPAKP